MASAAPAAASGPRVYLDLDVDGHQAAYQRACEFVAATNFKYGWSSQVLADLGGSERSRIQESYASDFEWSSKGRIEITPAKHTRIEIQLYTDAAPNCSDNFLHLCVGDKGKAKGSGVPLRYAGSHFHRYLPGQILQGGDFAHSNGSGGESIWGGRFKDDKAALKIKHSKRGLLSMCNTGPNANGSQFFITLSAQPKLDGKHCVFGEIVSGMEVLDHIEAEVKTADKSSGMPAKQITIMAAGKV